jgi:hypothetical protein
LLELQQSAVSLTTISQEPEGFQQGISLDKDCVESQQKQGVVHVLETDLVQAVRSGEVNVIIALANSIHIFDAGLGFLVGSFREVIDVDSASPESRYGTARICQVKVKGVLGPCIILAYGLNDLSSPINIQKFRAAITSARHILNNKVLSVDSEFSFKRPICVGTYPMGAMSKNRISPKTSIEIISEIFSDSEVPVKIFSQSHDLSGVGKLSRRDGLKRSEYLDWWRNGLSQFYCQQDDCGGSATGG